MIVLDLTEVVAIVAGVAGALEEADVYEWWIAIDANDRVRAMTVPQNLRHRHHCVKASDLFPLRYAAAPWSQ